ncbi:CheR family methyltransferase [Marinibaculum pumilum]|uniref:CheR family methyltransferase n=1 Tax=Marinibaculum pumilum TaxID=1766165 RepID=A0ABV7L9E2_9PROT
MSDRIEALLQDAIGLDAASIGPSVIDSAIRQRCEARGCAGEAAYWPLLAASAVERQALVEAVVVPETWFYRYPDSFALLQRLARERRDDHPGSAPLRLLSLPCSTGEEPYSMAIALLEAGLLADAFRIEAIDVSTQALAAAGTGIYGSNAFRDDLPQAVLRRHFIRDGKAWRIAGHVRDRVRFRRGSLLDPTLMGGELPCDFLFCRNLLIYFDRPTQQRAVRMLRRMLHRDGVLFAGPAEAASLSLCGMAAVGVPNSFAFRHPAPAATPPPPAARRTVPAAPASRPVSAPPPFAGNAASAGPAAPPSAAEDRDAELAAIASLADAGRTGEALSLCSASLARRGPDADLYYWLGLLHDAQDDADTARSYYRKALYLQPDHPEAGAQMTAHRGRRDRGRQG